MCNLWILKLSQLANLCMIIQSQHAMGKQKTVDSFFHPKTMNSKMSTIVSFPESCEPLKFKNKTDTQGSTRQVAGCAGMVVRHAGSVQCDVSGDLKLCGQTAQWSQHRIRNEFSHVRNEMRYFQPSALVVNCTRETHTRVDPTVLVHVFLEEQFILCMHCRQSKCFHIKNQSTVQDHLYFATLQSQMLHHICL